MRSKIKVSVFLISFFLITQAYAEYINEPILKLSDQTIENNQDNELPEFENLPGKVYEDENKGPMPLKRAKEFAGFPKDVASMPVDRSRIVAYGTYIVALLNTPIDTELGGGVKLLNEFDILGAEGYKILIPKGSQIFCTYTPLSKEGERKLNLFCNRVLTPDGVSINITNPSVDIKCPVKIYENQNDMPPIMTINEGCRIVLRLREDIYFKDPNANYSKQDQNDENNN